MFLDVVTAHAEFWEQQVDLNQASCIASAIYHEARGEDLLGKVMVAQVVLNRAGYRKTSPCEEVMRHKQFSFTLTPYKLRLRAFKRANKIDKDAAEESARIALQALTGSFEGMFNNAMHYFNPDKANPKWQYYFTNSMVVGNHKVLW